MITPDTKKHTTPPPTSAARSPQLTSFFDNRRHLSALIESVRHFVDRSHNIVANPHIGGPERLEQLSFMMALGRGILEAMEPHGNFKDVQNQAQRGAPVTLKRALKVFTENEEHYNAAMNKIDEIRRSSLPNLMKHGIQTRRPSSVAETNDPELLKSLSRLTDDLSQLRESVRNLAGRVQWEDSVMFQGIGLLYDLVLSSEEMTGTQGSKRKTAPIPKVTDLISSTEAFLECLSDRAWQLCMDSLNSSAIAAAALLKSLGEAPASPPQCAPQPRTLYIPFGKSGKRQNGEPL